MTTTDTLIDRVFDKRYVIKRKLGSGGMADVYLAEDQELGRRVALKLLDERHASDEQFVERLRHVPDDRGRLDRRHGAVPVAGAGTRRARRSALGPLFAGRRHVRDADGEGPVHRRHAGRDRDEAPLPGAEAALRVARRSTARP